MVAADADVFDAAAGVGCGNAAVFDVLPPNGRFGVGAGAGQLRAVEGDADGVACRAVGVAFGVDAVVRYADVVGVAAAAIDGDAVGGFAGQGGEVVDVVVVDAVVL